MNWKVAVALLLIISATAITTTSICLDASKPAHSHLKTLETRKIHKNLILYGDPVGGSGPPH